MSKFVFSPSEGAFYPEDLKDIYESVGTWPKDAVDVDDKTYQTYSESPPEGKVLGASSKGKPVWTSYLGDQSTEELEYSLSKRVARDLAAALQEVQILTCGVDVGMDLKGDGAKVNLLKKYIVELSRVPTQDGYPQEVTWPEHPLK